MDRAFMDDEHHEPQAKQLAISLGLFSIGLGAAELVAPRAVARLIGMREDSQNLALLRAFGAREIGSGVAILLRPDRPGPLWSRVIGDAVDLAVIGSASRQERADPQRLAAAAAAVAGVTALDVICAQMLGREDRRSDMDRPHEIHVFETITVNKPIEQVFSFWRTLENLPRFMRHLERVEVLDERRSRWHASGPAGMPVSWEAEIVAERDQEMISWRSLPNAMLQHHGAVEFRRAPGARGTEVRVELEYRPPAGTVGRTIGRMFGRNPEQQLQEDLRRFKQLLETGEISISDGPSLWRPARPSSNPDKLKSRAGVKP